MRLLRLSANKSTFHPVTFNRTGLSLVVAEQRSEEASETYNGVGKTLLLELFHYCLGSRKIAAFEQHLRGWVFALTIEMAGVEHTVSRRADEPNAIGLDGQDISLNRLKEFLESAALETASPIPRLSFRSVVPRFIRSGKSAYAEFRYASEGESKQPYDSMLRSAFLLGLDTAPAQKKLELRKRQESLTETMKQLQQEPIFAELLAEDTFEIELVALKEQAVSLQNDLDAFKVAEDYHEIEHEANRIKRKLDSHRRQTIKLSEAIGQIGRSLETKGELPVERVISLYREAQVALPEAVQRRIEDVVAFQKDLQQKRVLRLSQERQRLNAELRHEIELVDSMSIELNQKLGYLSEHRALDEYVAVSHKLSEVREKMAKVESGRALRESVDRELKRIKLDLAEENIRTDEYLSSIKPLTEEAGVMFRSFARELYGNTPSGLLIDSDSGDNQLRYRIDAHIASDASEGINEAKIFCFDMVILSLRRGHRMQFQVHDSTLFSPVDPRQTLQMFRIADRVCHEQGCQYIATLNLHDVGSIRQQTTIEDEEFDGLFGNNNVVLRLTDESPATKLLGIDVDMNYRR